MAVHPNGDDGLRVITNIAASAMVDVIRRVVAFSNTFPISFSPTALPLSPQRCLLPPEVQPFDDDGFTDLFGVLHYGGGRKTPGFPKASIHAVFLPQMEHGSSILMLRMLAAHNG